MSRITLPYLIKCDYDLLRYMIALPFEVFTPPAISAGIEVWTWVISEKPEFEIGVMMEINSAWLSSVKHEKGMFSTSMKYVIRVLLNLSSNFIVAVTTIHSTTQSPIVQQTKTKLIEGQGTLEDF